jgi:hypothetical protein
MSAGARATQVVLDDADLHLPLIADLLTVLARRPAGAPPVRLLLARHTRLWWDQLNRLTDVLADAYASPALTLSTGQQAGCGKPPARVLRREQRRWEQTAGYPAEQPLPPPEPPSWPEPRRLPV